MASYSSQNIYNATHIVDTFGPNGTNKQKTLTIKINRRDNFVQIKLVDCNDHSFNYTSNIDRASFELIKIEQCLDIVYDELTSQIVDLLKHTLTNEMLMRLECSDQTCKVIFYEKIRIKSLIFLTIDLTLTNKNEIIDEMSQYIKQLKDSNKNISFQLNTTRNEILDKEMMLKTALGNNKHLETQFIRDLKTIEKTFNTHITKVESSIAQKLVLLSNKHLKLVRDLDVVRLENKLKCESSVRLLNSLHSLRVENERSFQTIEDLKKEINNLKHAKTDTERNYFDFKHTNEKLDRENLELNKKITELHKDLQEATFIIAQKSKTHDEMAKDLVQANSMLVNFTNHYDNISKELGALKTILQSKELELREQLSQYNDLRSKFEDYKDEYKIGEVNDLKQELFLVKQTCGDLEKKNRETIKLNALLTRKLASGDNIDSTTPTTKTYLPWVPRNNI